MLKASLVNSPVPRKRVLAGDVETQLDLANDDTADQVINAAESNAVAFTVSGLQAGTVGKVTFADGADHQVVVNVAANGTYSANLSALTDGTISSSLSSTAPTGRVTSAIGNSVSLDTDSGLNPTLSVDAANPTDVKFTVSGLESDYSGTVTFTDSTGKSDVVAIGSDGNYSANLSNLTNGTLTYVMTVSDPAGNVITVDPTTTLGSPGDGSANASSGTPQLPTLLSGYAALPAWQVAGVDYHVGIPSGTVLLNPATISMPGVSVNTSTHTVTVTGNNVTLNGYDFSLNGGWQVNQAAGANNLTIENSNFVIGANNNNEVVQAVGAGPLTLLYNNFNGSGTAGSGANQETLVMASGSGLTAEYNYFTNAYSDFIDVGFGSGNYNILYNAFNAYGFGPSVHADVVQTWGNSIASLNVEYNTVYQPATIPTVANSFVRIGDVDLVLNGGGSYNGALHQSVNNPVIAYNTAIYAGSKNTVASFVQLNPDNYSAAEIVNPSIYDNYIDPSGIAYAVYWMYGGQPTYVVNPNIASNTNMKTGTTLLAGQYNDFNAGVPSGPPSAPVITGDTVTGANQNQVALTGTAPATTTIDVYDGSTFLGTATANSSGGWSFTTGTLSSGSHAFTATATDAFGNTGAPSLAVNQTVGALGPGITTIVESPSSGDLNAGNAVTLTINLSGAVTVAGGTPTLTLNDGGTATYSGGSGTSALTFSYTVGSGQNTASLAATAINLNGATMKDSGGNAANLSLIGLTQSGPQIDTTTPVISSIAETPPSGDLNAGKTVSYTLTMNEAVTVNTAGGSPTLALNDGGTATYTGGSGTNALTFSYTVLAGQNTPDLTVSAVNLNGATLLDGAGNAANLSLTGLSQGSPQIDTTTPTVSSVTGTAGDYNAGKVLTLTLNMSEAVAVTGTPTLTLNDGGTATYSSGSGTSALVFSYTVASGQNTAGLAVAAVNGTIADLAGNALSTGNLPETFTGVVIDTTTPTVSSVVASGTGITAGTGDLGVGSVVTLTVNLSEAVSVAGGVPTLTLNDGGTATYTGGSGSNALTFSYTVAAGQNTADLAVTAFNSNAATVTNGAGTAANLSGAVTNPAGTLQIDTTAPSVSSVVTSGSGITAGTGDLAAGSVVTLTVNLSEAVTVAGGTPTLTLNDGGTATYTGGSGSNALTFSYTVAAGQNTADLAVTAFNSNAATVTNGAGTAANLAGAVTNPAGTLQIDTTAPSVSSVVTSGSGITAGTGDLAAGSVVTLTVNLSEAVTVAGGVPTLTLNDGGTATYTGGSGSNALTFSYTVGAGQNTADLAVTAVNPGTATVTNGAGTAANLSGAVTNPAGIRRSIPRRR